MSKAGLIFIDGTALSGLITGEDELADIEVGSRVSWFYMVADNEQKMGFSLGWFGPHGAHHDIKALA